VILLEKAVSQIKNKSMRKHESMKWLYNLKWFFIKDEIKKVPLTVSWFNTSLIKNSLIYIFTWNTMYSYLTDHRQWKFVRNGSNCLRTNQRCNKKIKFMLYFNFILPKKQNFNKLFVLNKNCSTNKLYHEEIAFISTYKLVTNLKGADVVLTWQTGTRWRSLWK